MAGEPFVAIPHQTCLLVQMQRSCSTSETLSLLGSAGVVVSEVAGRLCQAASFVVVAAGAVAAVVVAEVAAIAAHSYSARGVA